MEEPPKGFFQNTQRRSVAQGEEAHSDNFVTTGEGRSLILLVKMKMFIEAALAAGTVQEDP
jgi:hypothetical protein